MTTMQTLTAKATEQTTEVLMGALLIMEAATTLTAEERMVKAAISDAITERHNLDDAMDEIFMADDFTGTYTDAIQIALARTNA